MSLTNKINLAIAGLAIGTAVLINPVGLQTSYAAELNNPKPVAGETISKHSQNQNLENILKEVRGVSETNPDLLPVIGYDSFKKREFQKAELYFKEASSRIPDYDKISEELKEKKSEYDHMTLVSDILRTGFDKNLKEKAKFMQKYMRHSEKPAMKYHLLVVMREAAGNWKEAQLYEKVLFNKVVGKEKYEKSEIEYDNLFKRYLKAGCELNSKNFDQAIKDAEVVIDKVQFSRAYAMLGEIYRIKGDSFREQKNSEKAKEMYKKADEYADKAIELIPTEYIAYTTKSYIKYWTGRRDLAAEDAQIAVNINPFYEPALKMLNALK